MYTILKYPLEAVEEQVISIPLTSKILSVESQGCEIVLYALAPKDNHGIYMDYPIRIFRTGYSISDDIEDFRFLDTVKMNNGGVMLHVFVKEF